MPIDENWFDNERLHRAAAEGIGGGIRIPPKSLLLFERLVNTVHKAAPAAAIAFNTVPQDTADAAARWFADA